MDKIKYPRTPHVFWSQGITSDDKTQMDYSAFDKEIIMTEKMDGENTTMYHDYIHARSLDSRSHRTQDWIRAFHAMIASEIPPTLRLCGENLFAKHSIEYDNLKSYFYLFSIWTDKNECLSWDNTLEWADMLGLTVVPQLHRSTWTDKPETIHKLWNEEKEDEHEGYVIRSTAGFAYDDFSKNVMKYVRKNHVTSDEHWKNQKIEKNKLKV